MAAGLNGNWQLLKAGGHDFPAGTVFQFNDGKLHYQYGNVHNGSYQLNGNNITLGPIMTTMMMTYLNPPEHVLDQEVNKAKAWAIEGDHLFLKDGAGNVVVEFRKQ
jgi:heat shock protein HslJ